MEASGFYVAQICEWQLNIHMNYLKPTYRIFLLRSKMSFSCHCYFSVLVFVAHSDVQLGDIVHTANT